MTQIELIKEFANGATDGVCSGGGNLKIENDFLIHFDTTILERYNDKFILNSTPYSDITRFLQKKIKSVISEDKLIYVEKVARDYADSLQKYLK